MTHVVTEACWECKDTECVEVCPVDCFHEDKVMLYIDPDECIDCGACIPVCPVSAIYYEDDVPADQQKWIELNAEKAPDLPVIDEKKEPYGKKC
ncbi:MAG: 4Fe-4S binding protein [Lentisphaeria bacterium]|nr:4Fe-4S binding protein [Lentisphaeria bacterium]